MNQLLWLRTDLRVSDNSALAAAMSAGPTVALYLITPGQWHAHDDAPCKVDFWLRNLAELSLRLSELNVPLLIRTVQRDLAWHCSKSGMVSQASTFFYFTPRQPDSHYADVLRFIFWFSNLLQIMQFTLDTY